MLMDLINAYARALLRLDAPAIYAAGEAMRAAVAALPPHATIYRIRHADGKRWRTMDSIGMPDWTEDESQALGLTLREHADRFAEDDPEDVRIVEVPAAPIRPERQALVDEAQTALRLAVEAAWQRNDRDAPYQRASKAIDNIARDAAPIDMVLHCPACGMQHVDAPEPPALHAFPFQHEVPDHLKDWRNPPHRSHLCHGCDHVWRPADVPTNGVTAIKTKGKADSPIAAGTPAATPAARWRENGEPDPHGARFDTERAALCMGTLTDDELANAVFLCDHRRDLGSIGYITAAKDRIRWLSRALVGADELRRAVRTMTAALHSREWAEHVSPDPDAQALEAAITALIPYAARESGGEGSR